MKMGLKLYLMCCCFLPFVCDSLEPYKAPPYSRIMDELVKRASKDLENKYHLKLIGITETTADSIKLLGFNFQIHKELTKDDARELIVNSVKDFLTEINQDAKIRPYLEVYPFDVRHIKMFIFIYPTVGGKLYYPNLAVVSSYNGEVVYYTNDPDTAYQYKSEEVETFEEAAKIVQSQQ